MPAANTANLMLRADVVAAVRNGDFRVVPVETVDQGMELLTGETMGDRSADGTYPEGTINRAIESRLQAFAERRRAFRSEDAAGA